MFDKVLITIIQLIKKIWICLAIGSILIQGNNKSFILYLYNICNFNRVRHFFDYTQAFKASIRNSKKPFCTQKTNGIFLKFLHLVLMIIKNVENSQMFYGAPLLEDIIDNRYICAVIFRICICT